MSGDIHHVYIVPSRRPVTPPAAAESRPAAPHCRRDDWRSGTAAAIRHLEARGYKVIPPDDAEPPK